MRRLETLMKEFVRMAAGKDHFEARTLRWIHENYEKAA